MSMNVSQANRAGRITSALGGDELTLSRIEGTECVDDLYSFTIDVVAKGDTIRLDALVGTNLTVSLTSAEAGDQHFNGIVTQARWTGVTDGHATCRLVLEPWLALLRHRRNQRIFHQKRAPDILQDLFGPYMSVGRYTDRLNESYPVLEYTVQYGESDLDFARRLMERYGISFFFEHGEYDHDLILVDAPGSYPMVEGGSRDLVDAADGTRGDAEVFWQWDAERNMTTGAVRLTDFNFKQPNQLMEVDRVEDAPFENGDIESYDYPGHYLVSADGTSRAGLRLDQHMSGDDRHRAVGNVLSMRAGCAVTLDGQADDTLKADYICLSATHSYTSGSVVNTGSDGGIYEGQYDLHSKNAPYRAPIKTPSALVHGPQTAWVVGEGEIDCDEFGRILVHFHWDLAQAYSMRCRVSQSWSGNGWGGMVIPRVGMEVIVEYLEGDPDKPIVTGCVYNGKNALPYDLPQHKTRSTFMTDTHEGQGFNELRFEDLKDKEEIFIHAQKDMNAKVENNASERVNNCQVTSVGHNRGTEIGNNDSEVVIGDKELLIGPSQKGRFTPSSAGSDTQGIGNVNNSLEGGATGQGNYEVGVEGNRNTAINKNDTLNVGQTRSEDIAKNKYVTVGKEYVLEAADKITLKCGKSVITLDKAGNISVNGTKISLKANSLAEVKARAIKLN